MEDTYRLYRPVASFEGQAAAPENPTKLKEPILEEYYLWAQVDTKRGLAVGNNTFRLVTGGTTDAPVFGDVLYTGEKLNSIHFFATVKDADGTLITKAQTQKVQ